MTNYNRRSFLQVCKVLSAGTVFPSFTSPDPSQHLNRALTAAGAKTPEQLADDEDFWNYVRQSYDNSPLVINLNNAGMSPAPNVVFEVMKDLAEYANQIPSYNRRQLDLGKVLLRSNLAKLCGASAQEIAVVRNASEAMETIIFGLPLKPGDEVVLSKQDYPNIVNAWKQRELREGIKLVWVNLALPNENDDYLAGAYTKLFTARTKVVHITHMINWNGQMLPVRQIADVAHQQGIEVVVDGAQTLAQFSFSIPELGADYFGASLHKWLGAPLSSGVLYVKKEKIKSLFALFAPPDLQTDDISKFEHFGTYPFFIEEAINKAIDFHDMIGIRRKEQRLFYLKNYWMEKLTHLPNVKLGTSLKPGFGCAIGLFYVKGKTLHDMEAFLMANYRIHCVSIDYEGIRGLRISPNVYTTTGELDMLVEGITALARS